MPSSVTRSGSTSKPAPPPPRPPPYASHVKQNASSLFYVKALSACLTGSLCGTLALPSIPGFIAYLFSSFLTSALFVLLKTGPSRSTNGTGATTTSRQPPVYFEHGFVKDVLFNGIGDNVLAFVLFWTFFYSVVHIYD